MIVRGFDSTKKTPNKMMKKKWMKKKKEGKNWIRKLSAVRILCDASTLQTERTKQKKNKQKQNTKRTNNHKN